MEDDRNAESGRAAARIGCVSGQGEVWESATANSLNEASQWRTSDAHSGPLLGQCLAAKPPWGSRQDLH